MKKKFLTVGIILASLQASALLAGSYISIEKATEIAKQKVPGGTISHIELDYDSSKTVYDIDIVLNKYEYDLKLDANTGKGISIKKELRDDAILPANTFISIEKAQSIAQSKVPGATIHKIDLDTKAGNGIYEIELWLNNYEYELKLDAKTGKGISMKKELRNDDMNHTSQSSSNQKPVANQKPAQSQFITREQAKAAALASVPNATVQSIELDRDDRVYELELRKGATEYDVVVSAVSGQVLSCEIED